MAHNDIFRSLMGVPRYESASSLFTEHRTFNLDSISRNAIFSLIERLLGSDNEIVKAVCNSAVRVHSKLWKRWAVALGAQWEFIMML